MSWRLILTDLLKRSTIYKSYKKIKELHHLPLEIVENEQLRKMKSLIIHAYENVPYYKKVFEKLHLTPNDFNSIEDLKKLPVLTKKIIRDNPHQFVAKNASKFDPYTQKTGGSTGVPLNFLVDKKSWSLHWAMKFRSWEFGGYQIGDNVGLVGGSSLISKNTPFSKRLWSKLMNFHSFPTERLNNDSLNKIIIQLKKKQIQILRGYPNDIARIAEFVKKNDIEILIKLVICTAETLTDENRDLITSSFNCNIIDNYGSSDGGGHATSCKQNQGFHIFMTSAIWEVEENQYINDIENGDVILTNLFNYSMPFIRYKPNDIITKEFDYNTCTCGRTSPRIKKIIGRSPDPVVMPNEEYISDYVFTKTMTGLPIRQWQVLIQEDSLVINILLETPGEKSVIEEINNRLIIELEGIKYDIKESSSFIKAKSGKHKIIIDQRP